eukprot:Hpha_TRINITY_DN15437_c1_g7::TRINITY_DN15437_c1_g7_i1::g.173639::m.173639/K01719/hemD, UROS; uroporphyrinogen-III synthase
MSRGVCVLLKDPPEEGEPDLYGEELRKAGWEAQYVSCIRTENTNTAEVEGVLNTPGEFAALVFTSARAAAAVHAHTELTRWAHVPCWVVGAATARAARSAFAAAGVCVDPKGAECGGAAALAEALAADWRRDEEKGRGVLWLCGRERRPELSAVLAKAEVPLKCVECYAAVQEHDRAALDAAARAIGDGGGGAERPRQGSWVVLFSGKGISAATELCARCPSLRAAAIGKTTAAAAGGSVAVDAVAEKPSPAGLVAALLASSTPAPGG